MSLIDMALQVPSNMKFSAAKVAHKIFFICMHFFVIFQLMKEPELSFTSTTGERLLHMLPLLVTEHLIAHFLYLPANFAWRRSDLMMILDMSIERSFNFIFETAVWIRALPPMALVDYKHVILLNKNNGQIFKN